VAAAPPHRPDHHHVTGLRVAGLSVALDEVPVLVGVELDVPAGTVTAVVGPNGSGKSTLLRCIYRALRPAAGTVVVFDRDVWSLSARESARRSAVVGQHTGDATEFTAAEAVAMGRTPHKGLLAGDSAADRDLCAGALERVGMTAYADRPLGTLSGGERQRVVIARALAQQAPLLLLDEPTNHLDVRHQHEVLGLVRDLGLTVVAALHDLDLAMAYSDAVVVLDRGRVVASGAPDEVLVPLVVREVFGVDAVVVQHPVTSRNHLLLTASSPSNADVCQSPPPVVEEPARA